ncbi:MAG: response regulator [Phycisphaerales bacterium]|nr:response regulator [Phycisphaerales bacterium]
MRQDIAILLVEDDLIDVKTVRRAFEDSKVVNPLYVVGNGEEALDYLRRKGKYADPELSPRPGLILLDLNMPIMDGLTFLETYRRDKNLCTIPAVVLTTSDEERDRLTSYSIGIAGYIVKPVDFKQFVEAVQTIDLYWSLCRLPSE